MLSQLKIRGIFSLAVIFILQGCGFRPLYPVTTDEQKSVYIAPIQDREGQMLRHHLQELFGADIRKSQSPYAVTVTLEKSKQELGFRRDETSRRTRITLHARYTLVEKTTEKVLISQPVSVVTGYSVGSKSSFSSFPLIVSEKDAVKKGLALLARDIHISISTFLASTNREKNEKSTESDAS